MTGPACACGCGEFLPENSTRQFKRNHDPNKKPHTAAGLQEWRRAESLATAQDQANGFPAVNLGLDLNGDPQDTNDIPEWSMDAARDAVPDDPEPSYQDKQTTSTEVTKPTMHLTGTQKKDIEAKLLFWLELGTMMLAPLDQVCVPVASQHAPNIAKKMLPIICQSEEMVQWFTKAGNFALWADLAMACWPVISAIIAHHITKTIENKEQQAFVPNDMYSTENYAA